jgi:hypothetical protein
MHQMGRFASLEVMLRRSRGGASPLVFVLVLSIVACASPTVDSPGSTSPEAQATSVRRTAVAEVQRIIAGNLSATATPEATPTAAPSCSEAIWWHQARSHVGEYRTIQGPVVAVRPAPGATTLLQVGQVYPDPMAVAVLVPAGAEARLNGRTICVAGRIGAAAGAPTIEIRDAAAIVVVN